MSVNNIIIVVTKLKINIEYRNNRKEVQEVVPYKSIYRSVIILPLTHSDYTSLD